MTALDEVNNENNFVKSKGKAGDAGEEATRWIITFRERAR